MTDSILFISTVIVALTQVVKMLFPKINGAYTVVVALLVGVVVALVDTRIGLADITVAAGILAGLSAVGIVTVAGKIGSQS